MNNSQPQTELNVAVLELLPENAPLDDFLADMEERALEYYKFIRETLNQSGFPDATVQIWQGLEPEATEMVADRAARWQADTIYVAMSKPCYICQENKQGRKARFGQKEPEENNPFDSPLVNPDLLCRKINGAVAVTCHGEMVMTLRNSLRGSSKAESRRTDPLGG
ncbi:MAG TPA: hypothetical protein VH186_23335 [Chloroflexia bacterium]|nr:hypothetical protein [Chloroflexia bacterium]